MCAYTYLPMHVCTMTWLLLAHHQHPASTRLAVAVNHCQPACMHVGESGVSSTIIYHCLCTVVVGTYPLYVRQYWCVVIKVGHGAAGGHTAERLRCCAGGSSELFLIYCLSVFHVLICIASSRCACGIVHKALAIDGVYSRCAGCTTHRCCRLGSRR
jgi:hypothetical protein